MKGPSCLGFLPVIDGATLSRVEGFSSPTLNRPSCHTRRLARRKGRTRISRGMGGDLPLGMGGECAISRDVSSAVIRIGPALYDGIMTLGM